MQKLTLPQLKQHLKNKSVDELVKEIGELYKKFPDVQDYYKNTLTESGKTEVVRKYNKIIKNEFFPERGMGRLNLAVARKAVNDFKKISTSSFDIANIMIFYVENGVEFTNEYGDINESFYSSIECMFESALKYIRVTEQEEEFYTCCEKIVNDTSGIGWGFHDTLSDLFAEYFES
jgi:hypothetical protein